MLCPVCQETLRMLDRQGVEIDYCPKCRGVWLDRGELEKLIERSAGQPYPPRQPSEKWSDDDSHYDQRRDDSDDGFRKPQKRESWLSRILDFG